MIKVIFTLSDERELQSMLLMLGGYKPVVVKDTK